MNTRLTQIIILVLVVIQIHLSMCLAEEKVLTDISPVVEEATSEEIKNEERRQYNRFNIKALTKPVSLETEDKRVKELIDISRGGIAIKHDGTIKEGDVVPIQLTYKDIIIDAEVMVLNSTDTRAGAQYINPYSQITKQLLYLSILLEADNHLLKTKLAS